MTKMNFSTITLREDLQKNFFLCLFRILSRLLIISKNPEEINFISQILLQNFNKINFYNDYQEIFCIGILVDNLINSKINNLDNYFDIDSLTNLMNSLDIDSNNYNANDNMPYCSGKLKFNFTDETIHSLLIILEKIVDEMNLQLLTPEDLILNNIKSILVDSNDFFFLIDKIFVDDHSQIYSVVNHQSLVGNFKLRDKLKNTLKLLIEKNIISQSHSIIDKI